jgi:cold shock CspA family protein
MYKEASGLEKVCDYIVGCRIVVEKPHKHPRSGSLYRVKIEIDVPHNPELVVTREPGEGKIHESLQTSLRQAFRSARRQLKKLVDKQREEIKTHPFQQAKAVVYKLFPKKGYGFLKTVDGRDIYFHKNSVLHGGFDRLAIGTGVSFSEEKGKKGPEASSVQIIDKPGSRVSDKKEKMPPPLGWKKK